MKTRILSIITAIVVLMLTACGNDNNTNPNIDEVTMTIADELGEYTPAGSSTPVPCLRALIGEDKDYTNLAVDAIEGFTFEKWQTATILVERTRVAAASGVSYKYKLIRYIVQSTFFRFTTSYLYKIEAANTNEVETYLKSLPTLTKDERLVLRDGKICVFNNATNDFEPDKAVRLTQQTKLTTGTLPLCAFLIPSLSYRAGYSFTGVLHDNTEMPLYLFYTTEIDWGRGSNNAARAVVIYQDFTDEVRNKFPEATITAAYRATLLTTTSE